MAYHSAADDIEDEISSWGYTTTFSDYERSLQATGSQQPQTKVGGRGRGILNPQHMSSVRLASEISDLKVHSFPMGHLPTSKEILACSAENEITPMLRQLGLSSRDDEIHSKNTRKNIVASEEIRIDGNVPVILNSELFRNAGQIQDEGIDEPENFDPEQPVPEQFSTIPELAIAEEDDIHVVENISKQSKSKKSDLTNSSIDSAVTTSSTSSNQSKKNAKEGKGKKKKWRKLTADELKSSEPQRDRYEEVYSVGVHDNSLGNYYTARQLHGESGIKGWSSHY